MSLISWTSGHAKTRKEKYGYPRTYEMKKQKPGTQAEMDFEETIEFNAPYFGPEENYERFRQYCLSMVGEDTGWNLDWHEPETEPEDIL